MTLAIISHTEHFRNANGQIVGWGATIREINHLTEIFDKVVHIAPLYEDAEMSGLLPYESDRIEFVPLKPSGGESIIKKIGIIATAPHNLSIIIRQLNRCDVFQFRAPTGMGLYVIPYLLFSGKKGWFKYAGNWIQENPPLGYKIQRHFLTKQNNYLVTINGHWQGQKQNLLTFENPCLTEEERKEGKLSIDHKDTNGILDFVFVGRLENAKGVQRILNVFSKLTNNRIGKIHLIGDGPMKSAYEDFVRNHNLKNVIFHGFLTRVQINSILKKSHVFLLPSDSEGFPKVVAEAANYGLIPIVSDVSSIGQYVIENKTGFLIGQADEALLKRKIEKVLGMSGNELYSMACSCYSMSEKFTYSYYNKRIKTELIHGIS